MDTTLLETACRASGMLESAVPDGVRRLQSHFSQMADPTPALVAEQLTALRETAKHLFPQQAPVSDTSETGVPTGVPESVWRSLSPASKLAYAREHGYGLPPPERRRPPLPLTSEQAAALAKLAPAARLDAYRALQAQQQRP
jgi:hypothetical protein